jgi:ABC-type iron transport system FetAB permease component
MAPTTARAGAEAAGGGERRRDWHHGLLAGLAGLVLLLLMDALVRDAIEPRGDDLIYELMAQEPFEVHSFPFAYRVLVPTLVHVLPFDHTFSFSLLAWLSSAACGSVGYVLMRRFSAPRWLAAGLAVCLVTCPALFVTSLRQGRNVDPETVLVMLAGGLAIADRRPLALGIVVVVGAFVRESALFLIPFAYAVWAARLWDVRAARKVALAGAPGVAVYVALRLALPTVGSYGPLVSGRVELLKDALSGPLGQVRRIFLAFGPVWFAALYALRDLRYARRGLVLVAACVFSMLLAGDWGRVILLAAPVMYAGAAHTLRDRPRAAALVLAGFAAMNVVYAVYMHETGVEKGIRGGPLPEYPVR